MHPYLPHILADIAAAHRTEISEEEKKEQTLEEHFEEIERWIAGKDSQHTFGYYCGLQAESFPPAAQLTDAEMKTIIEAFEKMMFTWNLGVDIPDTVPIPFAYKLTVDTLNKKTGIVNSGMITFDFCTGYAPDCELKEYCPCLDFWNNDNESKMDS